MRVLFISKYAVPPLTSGKSRQYLLCNKLAGRGHRVQLVCSRSNGMKQIPSFCGLRNTEIAGNLETILLNGPIIRLGFNFKRIYSWIIFEINNFMSFNSYRKFKPDVIIVSSLSLLTFIFGVFLKKTLQIPLILEVRDLYPLTLIEVGGLSKKNLFIRFLSWVEKYGYKNADYIISPLSNSKCYFDSIKGESVRFKYLPIGFSKEMYTDTPDDLTIEILKKIGKLKQEGRFIVGYAGTIGRANALEWLLAIAGNSLILDHNIHFVLIGDGPDYLNFQNTFQMSNITFFPRIGRRYVPIVLSECSILYNSWLKRRIYDYGVSPNKWIDYMYSGRPILLALDSESELFHEAKCGWKIEAENSESLLRALLRISEETKEKLDTLGANGKNYLLNKLDYKTIVDDLEAIIHTTLGNGPCN